AGLDARPTYGGRVSITRSLIIPWSLYSVPPQSGHGFRSGLLSLVGRTGCGGASHRASRLSIARGPGVVFAFALRPPVELFVVEHPQAALAVVLAGVLGPVQPSRDGGVEIVTIRGNELVQRLNVWHGVTSPSEYHR